MSSECENNSFDIEKSILNDIKKNNIKNFKELIDYYFDELEKLKPVWKELNNNATDSIENNTEKYNETRDCIELLNGKLIIIMEEKTNFFYYYLKQ